jgi:selenocysteine-specific elongation factor
MADDLGRRLLTLVGEFHRLQPLADGIPREEARERLFARADPQVFELVLGALSAGGHLVVRDRLALPGHRLALSPDEDRARGAVEEAYRRGGLKPPDAATIAADTALAPALVEKMTALLLRQKQLTRVDTLIFHSEALGALKRDVQSLKSARAGERATVDVGTFKDRYGVTRKYAIPLLEWLDRERLTKRVGETRIVL